MRTRLAGPPNPFEVYLLVAAALTGTLYTLGLFVPASIRETLPPLLRMVWGLSLMVGGIVALTGLFWPGHPITAIMIKRTGLLTAGFGTLAYAIAIIAVFGTMAIGVSITNGAFTAACFWRSMQVTVVLRDAKKRFHEARDSGDCGRGDT